MSNYYELVVAVLEATEPVEVQVNVTHSSLRKGVDRALELVLQEYAMLDIELEEDSIHIKKVGNSTYQLCKSKHKQNPSWFQPKFEFKIKEPKDDS